MFTMLSGLVMIYRASPSLQRLIQSFVARFLVKNGDQLKEEVVETLPKPTRLSPIEMAASTDALVDSRIELIEQLRRKVSELEFSTREANERISFQSDLRQKFSAFEAQQCMGLQAMVNKLKRELATARFELQEHKAAAIEDKQTWENDSTALRSAVERLQLVNNVLQLELREKDASALRKQVAVAETITVLKETLSSTEQKCTVLERAIGKAQTARGALEQEFAQKTSSQVLVLRRAFEYQHNRCKVLEMKNEELRTKGEAMCNALDKEQAIIQNMPELRDRLSAQDSRMGKLEMLAKSYKKILDAKKAETCLLKAELQELRTRVAKEPPLQPTLQAKIPSLQMRFSTKTLTRPPHATALPRSPSPTALPHPPAPRSRHRSPSLHSSSAAA